jgi:hypothetical protein
MSLRIRGRDPRLIDLSKSQEGTPRCAELADISTCPRCTQVSPSNAYFDMLVVRLGSCSLERSGPRSPSGYRPAAHHNCSQRTSRSRDMGLRRPIDSACSLETSPTRMCAIDDGVASRDTPSVISRRVPGLGKRKRVLWRCRVRGCRESARATSPPLCPRHKELMVRA